MLNLKLDLRKKLQINNQLNKIRNHDSNNPSHRFVCRDEAWLEVMVALPAKVMINLPKTDGKVVVETGEALEVGYSIQSCDSSSIDSNVGRSLTTSQNSHLLT